MIPAMYNKVGKNEHSIYLIVYNEYTKLAQTKPITNEPMQSTREKQKTDTYMHAYAHACVWFRSSKIGDWHTCTHTRYRYHTTPNSREELCDTTVRRRLQFQTKRNRTATIFSGK